MLFFEKAAQIGIFYFKILFFLPDDKNCCSKAKEEILLERKTEPKKFDLSLKIREKEREREDFFFVYCSFFSTFVLVVK